MTSKEKIAEIKDIMASSGLWVVGDEIWPYDEFHLVNVASSKADLDPLKLADEIAKRTGVICSPLPKKASTPNIYTFLAYRATPTATITTPSGPVPAHVYVSDVEDSLEDLGVTLVAVYAYPLNVDIDGAEDLVEAAHAFVRPFTGPEVPTLIADNEPVTPHTWYWLRVTPVGQPPLDTGYVKALLEEQGYKVIAPDKGISGFFEETSTYVTQGGTYVLFNSGAAMDASAANLRSAVFAPLGELYPGFFMTPELVEGQSTMDTFYGFQGVEEGAKGLGDDTLGFVKELLSMLQTIMKSLPVIIWAALGGAVVFLGWNIYKYIREERSRPSVLRRKERRAYEERY